MLLLLLVATILPSPSFAEYIKCEHEIYGRDSGCILIDSKSECEETSGCTWVGPKYLIGPIVVIFVAVCLLIGGSIAIWRCCCHRKNRDEEEETATPPDRQQQAYPPVPEQRLDVETAPPVVKQTNVVATRPDGSISRIVVKIHSSPHQANHQSF